MPSPNPAPFPQHGSYISTVRSSSRATREAHNIALSSSAIDTFLLSLDAASYNRLKTQHGLVFPLAFPSVVAEVNFLSLLSLLNTLSGYRAPFHAATGSGAYQNVQRLLFGLYLSGSDEGPAAAAAGSSHLTAAGLASLTAASVADVLGVSLHQERQHETMPAITVGVRAGPINEAVELVVQLCNQTGQRLQEAGYPSLGAFVIESLNEANQLGLSKGEEAAADLFVEKVVTFLPGFNDSYLLPSSGPVYVYKKAFFLLQALRQRLHPSSSMKVPPTNGILPMFVDNVIPTMMVQLGVLDLSSSTVESLKGWGPVDVVAAAASPDASNDAAGEGKGEGKKEGPLLSTSDAYVVRAAALDAGVAIVQRARQVAEEREGEYEWLKTIDEVDLDGYLWAVAKDDPSLRAVPRLVERDTVMY